MASSSSKAAKMTDYSGKDLFQIKIVLAGSKPPIWRRLIVPKTITLDSLHYVLQLSMGWINCHLHFWHKANPQERPEATPCFFDPPGDEVADEVALNKVIRAKGDKLKYQYDTGDNWIHYIILEETSLPDQKLAHLPICIGGEERCPAEDAGGIVGYYEKLQEVQDPDNEEREETAEWLKRDLVLREYDLEAINKRILARSLTRYPGADLYQIKVTLVDSKPSVWRRLIVPKAITLDKLHVFLQAAMGWENIHPYSFEIGNSHYQKSSGDSNKTQDVKDSTCVELDAVLLKKSQKLKYRYDFKDDWLHEIEVEKFSFPDKSKYDDDVIPAYFSCIPRCMEAKGQCPEEGSGGIQAYQQKLKDDKDKKKPDKKEYHAWAKQQNKVHAINERFRSLIIEWLG